MHKCRFKQAVYQPNIPIMWKIYIYTYMYEPDQIIFIHPRGNEFKTGAVTYMHFKLYL